MFKHLSVSNANEFIERRGRWYLSRVAGFEFAPNAKMHSGSAVEKAVQSFCFENQSAEDSTKRALEWFDQVTADMDSNDIRASLPACMLAGMEAMQALMSEQGPIVNAQNRIFQPLNDGGMDWLGFSDFEFENLGVDLKWTGRTPSKLSGGHARQGAFYSHATGKPWAFLYVIPLKSGVKTQILELPPEEVAPRIEQLRGAERAIEQLFESGDDAMCAACLPDWDAYYLNDDDVREAAVETWKEAA